jgi:adenine deaminase
MSDATATDVVEQMGRLLAATHEMGSGLDDVFFPLSFLTLEVIPSLRLTDLGLVDVEQFDIVPLWV